MNFTKAIEIYCNMSNIDMRNDVMIIDNILEVWNIENITKPTIQQLEKIWNDNQVGANRIRELQIIVNSSESSLLKIMLDGNSDLFLEDIQTIYWNAKNEIKDIEANYAR